jgi:glycerophosphoryl diester phosphodiesterase
MKKIILLLLPLSFWLPYLSYAQNLRGKIQSDKIIVCSHRAAMSPETPENSLYSMKRSKSAGLDMHEIDLAESKDGVLYLLHDKTLDRTTESTGLISDKHSEELDKVRLRGLEEPLPRFEHALEFAKENRIFLMLDIKEAPLEKVISMVDQFGMLDQVMVLTFSSERAEEALGLQKRFLLSVLITQEEDLDFYICKTNDPYHLIAYINQNASTSLFQKTRDLGLPIVTDVMGKVDQEAQYPENQSYTKFVALRKPNILVSDYPLLLRSALEN